MQMKGKVLLGFSIMLAAAGITSLANAASTTLVSITPQKIVANDTNANIALSKSGLQSVFESDATNLVLHDGNNARDVFLKVGSSISRVSVNSLGYEARNSRSGVDWFDATNYADSTNASISSDGKLVAFQSQADNLDQLTLDTNGVGMETDVFLRDVTKKKTYRLSGIMAGQLDASTPDAPWRILVEANDVSSNPYVAGTLKQAWVSFESYATNLLTPVFTSTVGRKHIYVVDLKTKKLEMIDAVHDALGGVFLEGNADSSNASMSADGRFVVYQSNASNLVNAPTTNNVSDIFVYDRKRFTTYQISGVLSPSVTLSGWYVSAEPDGSSAVPSIVGDGKSKTKSYMIAFESRATNMDLSPVPGGDTGTDRDVFVVEFAAQNPADVNSAYEIKSLKRISSPQDAVSGLPTGEAQLQLNGNGGNNSGPQNRAPVIGGTNLAYTVAFRSTADNLLAVDPLNNYWNQDSNFAEDIYVYNSKTRLFTRANVDVAGEQGSAVAINPAISLDGKAIGFETGDDYLVPETLGDGSQQVYIYKQ